MRKDLVDIMASWCGFDPDIVIEPDEPDIYANDANAKFIRKINQRDKQRMYSLSRQARDKALAAHRTKRESGTDEKIRPWIQTMQALQDILEAELRFTHTIPDEANLHIVEGWKVYAVCPPTVCASCQQECPAAGTAATEAEPEPETEPETPEK